MNDLNLAPIAGLAALVLAVAWVRNRPPRMRFRMEDVRLLGPLAIPAFILLLLLWLFARGD